MMNISFIHCTRFPPEQKQQMFPVIIKLNTLYVRAVPKKNKCTWLWIWAVGGDHVCYQFILTKINLKKLFVGSCQVKLFLLNPSVE